MMRQIETSELPDCKQSAWQLAAIQLSGWTSLPILATSLYILEKNSFLGAVFTIVVGNAILWFIRLGILSMSYKRRQSTLDIARDYLGEAGNWSIAILLLATTLFWFIVQTNTGSLSINKLLSLHEGPGIDQFTQISVFLGLVSTLFCMGGIVMLRRLAMISFPILCLAFFYILFAAPDRIDPSNDHPRSFYGLTLVLATNLGITADLPTFFRHSKSWPESIKGLTIVQLVSLVLGISGLYLGGILSDGFTLNPSVLDLTVDPWLRYILIGFVFLSLICANVANVYSASVGWELVAPKALVGKKEYFILGLGLTTIFILVAGLFPLDLPLEIADSILVKLCLVLLVGSLIAQRYKRLPDRYEQGVYFSAWSISSLLSVLQLSGLWAPAVSSLFVGFTAILAVIGIGFGIRFLRKR